jgi:hypothetical protein
MYDHVCSWLRLTVFLPTIKPFLVVVVFLLFDALFVGSLSVYALVTAAGTRIHAMDGLLFSAILAIFLIFGGPLSKVYWLGCRNALSEELGIKKLDASKRHFVMARRADDTRVEFVKFPVATGWWALSSPWELSMRENLHEALGESVLSWPLFWVAPRRVRQYDEGYDENSDFPLGKLYVSSRRPTCVVFNPPTMIEMDVSAVPVPARQISRRREVWPSGSEPSEVV